MEKIREQTENKKNSRKASKPASKIQDVDLGVSIFANSSILILVQELNKMAISLSDFQKSYGTSEAVDKFFAGLL